MISLRVFKAIASIILGISLASAVARAGAPLAGMGGVGTGIPMATGDIADNPSASSAGLRRHEGAFSAGASWLRLGFSGNGMNQSEKTTAWFQSGSALSWSLVTPMLGAGRGRLAMGSWQVDRRVLRLNEPLDLSILDAPLGAPLSGSYISGLSRLRRDEGLYAHGISWIQAVFGGDHTLSVGGALLTLDSRESLEVTGDHMTQKDVVVGLRNVSRRAEMLGPGVTVGWYFRPVPGGSIGASMLYAGPMQGKVWEQADGGPVMDDTISRAAHSRISVGGSFILFDAMTAALDLRYCGGMQTAKTYFAGTASERILRERSDSVFSVSAGMEYKWRLKGFDLPLRAGFFTKPDAMPSLQSDSISVPSVKDLVPAPFRQDLMGVTAGTGFESGPLRADFALVWLMVDTKVRVPGPAGEVESGDARNSFGAVVSFSSRFGGGSE